VHLVAYNKVLYQIMHEVIIIIIIIIINNTAVETIHEDKFTILWNQQVRTDRTIPNNKLDIIIFDNKQGTFMLIDVAIPGDRNVTKKEAEKILEYKDLIIEIQRMWNVTAKVIPVITGATGIILKSLRQYLNNIPEKHELNKNSRMGHCSHTTENANVKVQNTFQGQK